MIFIKIFFIPSCLCESLIHLDVLVMCDTKISVQKLLLFPVLSVAVFSLLWWLFLLLLKESNSSAMPPLSSASLEEDWCNTGKTQS